MKFQWFGRLIDTEQNKLKRKIEPEVERRHFNIGDRIVYPYHGKGTITEIVDRDGIDFFKIYLDSSGVRLLVPMHNLRVIGACFLDEE